MRDMQDGNDTMCRRGLRWKRRRRAIRDDEKTNVDSHRHCPAFGPVCAHVAAPRLAKAQLPPPGTPGMPSGELRTPTAKATAGCQKKTESSFEQSDAESHQENGINKQTN